MKWLINSHEHIAKSISHALAFEEEPSKIIF